ncbi:MAG: DUF58 domain-containing protein [Verrucomicrobiae bacterium]|nr:DUF58 domain-containing protein [Verrucomicrobiae bacterium]
MDPEITREILRKVRHVEIRTRRLVTDALAGQYHSVFKGRGMNFEEVREYQPGDEVRSIDWNVTARTGRPFVKKFTEERELTILLLVDVSGSNDFGSTTQSKRELAAELGSVLAFSAIRNNDKVGVILFSDRIELYIPPRKGRSHVLRSIRDILFHEPAGRGTSIRAALDFAIRVMNRRAVMFLISDFQDEGYETLLRLAARRHDLIGVHVQDRREQALPALGLLTVEDPETGEQCLVETNHRDARLRFSELAEERLVALRHALRQAGVDSLELRTGESYIAPLIRFFRKRAQRR